MALTSHLGEALRPVPAVERLELIGHGADITAPGAPAYRGDGRPTRRVSPGREVGGAAERSSQVACGTPASPLRAAAFRP